MSTVVLNRHKSRPRIVLNISPRKYDFFMELLRNFDFVQVEHGEYDGDSREAIVANLKEAANDLKLIREGKLEGRPVEELINEL